jgi:hypothetical protein
MCNGCTQERKIISFAKFNSWHQQRNTRTWMRENIQVPGEWGKWKYTTLTHERMCEEGIHQEIKNVTDIQVSYTSMFTLPSQLFSTDFVMWAYQYVKCSWAHILSCFFMCYSFASFGHAVVMCSTVSSNCLQNLHLLSLSLCNIFVAWYLFCNAWSCAAIINFQCFLSDLPLTDTGTRLLC